MRSARSTRHRLAAALLVAAVTVLALPSAAHGAPPQRPAITLTAQSPWVQPGGAFRLGLHVDGIKDPSAVELVLNTYARLTSRSSFSQSLQDRAVGALLDVTSTPLSDLDVDQAGNLTATLQFQDPTLPRDPGRLLLSQDGVYPLRVELREKGGGAVLDRFTTHIPYLAANRSGPKLDLSWIVPVHAAPTIRPDGTRKLTNAKDLQTFAQTLESTSLPLVLAPTPETVEALSTSSDSAAAGALSSLRRAASSNRQVVTGPYVPTNLSQLIAGGLESEADQEVQRGNERLTQLLKLPVDTSTWVSEEPLDDASMARLQDLGVTQVAMPESSLTPLQSRLTLARTYYTDARQAGRHQAVSIDDGLSTHFRNDGNQVLQAHQFLADLAVLYFDQPGQQRGVVAFTPRSWHPDKTFLDTAMAGLTDNPVVDPVTLNTLFSGVDKLRGGNGAPLVRKLVGPPRNVSLPTAAIRSARQRLNNFASIVDDGNPMHTLLDEQLLTANSADLRSSRQRTYVSGVEKGLDHELSRIQTPAGSIRLTARSGQIPVTFRNGTGYPVHVVVTVRSDKLEFPGAAAGGHPANEITQKLDLVRRNETTRFAVQTRASGAFPLLVTLQSPDGSLIVSHTQITVRSTAASGVGLGLAAAAGLFLLLWWGRHFLHGRRAGRLVPA